MSDEPKKACPVLGCKERIAYTHFACKIHWYELPPNLRSKVFHAYAHRVRSGQVERHIEAVRQCYEFYKTEGYGLQ